MTLRQLWAFIAGLVLWGCSPSDSSPPEPGADTRKVEWYQVETTNGPTTVSMLIRAEMPRSDPAFGTLVTITWPYFAATDSSKPPVADQGQMDLFESALEPLKKQDGFSILVLKLVGFGRVEWAYYTSDYPKFEAAFNKYLEGLERYPIKLDYSADPEWNFFNKFRDAMDDKVQSSQQQDKP